MNIGSITHRNYLFAILSTLIFFLIHPVLFNHTCQADGGEKYRLRTVVIDAGHGGKDPGAIGKYAKEKDITLKIALKLGGYIEKNFSDVHVIYTRTKDEFIALDERAEIANSNKADLFISIHVNANHSRSIHGTSTYVMGLHKSEENLEVAKRENSVISYEKDYKSKYNDYFSAANESHIIISHVVNTFMDQSLLFASKIQEQFNERARRHNLGVKQAGLLVLWNTTMPSVLVETGFITNTNEEKYLSSTYGQEIIASAIFRAFRDYKKLIENKSNFYTSANEEPADELTLNTEKDSQNQNISKNELENSEAEKKHIELNNNTALNSDDIMNHTKESEMDNTFFRIQVKSSVKPVTINITNFKGLQNVEEKKIDGLYKYFYGKEYTVDDILRLQEEVRKKISDAFVVAFKNGELISFRQALKNLK